MTPLDWRRYADVFFVMVAVFVTATVAFVRNERILGLASGAAVMGVRQAIYYWLARRKGPAKTDAA